MCFWVSRGEPWGGALHRRSERVCFGDGGLCPAAQHPRAVPPPSHLALPARPLPAGDEGPLDGPYPSVFMDMARDEGGLLLFIEHRYYGQSQPLGPVESYTNAGLRWLTIENALADFAAITAAVRKVRLRVKAAAHRCAACWAAYPHACRPASQPPLKRAPHTPKPQPAQEQGVPRTAASVGYGGSYGARERRAGAGAVRPRAGRQCSCPTPTARLPLPPHHHLGGSLAAWARLLHPRTFQASLASSSVVRFMVGTQSFERLKWDSAQAITRSVREVGGEACAARVALGFAALQGRLSWTNDGRAQLAAAARCAGGWVVRGGVAWQGLAWHVQLVCVVHLPLQAHKAQLTTPSPSAACALETCWMGLPTQKGWRSCCGTAGGAPSRLSSATVRMTTWLLLAASACSPPSPPRLWARWRGSPTSLAPTTWWAVGAYALGLRLVVGGCMCWLGAPVQPV